MSRPYTAPTPPYEWVGQRINLQPGDYQHAVDHATSQMARHADTPHNRYWSSFELAVHGYLSEIAVFRFLNLEPCLSTDDSEGGADVLGIYQVKNNTWHRPFTMDNWDGGHCYVPVKTQAPVVVLISMFANTLRKRAFYEGWTTPAAARRWPIKRGFRLAHAVPYMELRRDPLPPAGEM